MLKLSKCFNKLVEHIYVLQTNVTLQAGDDVIRYDVSGRGVYINEIPCIRLIAPFEGAHNYAMRNAIPTLTNVDVRPDLRVRLMNRLNCEHFNRKDYLHWD